MFNFNGRFSPANDTVFSRMFVDKHLFAELLKAVTGKKIKIKGEPITQAVVQERIAMLNVIKLDVFAETSFGMASIDLQNRYYKERVENRSVYYAARMISRQDVENMEYENVKSVHVSFILSRARTKNSGGLEQIRLRNVTTGEDFGSLMGLSLVYVPTVVQKADKNSDLYVFSRFFAIKKIKHARKFLVEFQNNKLAKELIRMYDEVVLDPASLEDVERLPYYTNKSKAAIKAEARAKGIEEGMAKGIQQGIEQGQNQERMRVIETMISSKCGDDFIMNVLDISYDKLNEYKKKIQDERPSVRLTTGDSQIHSGGNVPEKNTPDGR
ncbi:MAG: Rpn family recombination-promoting nuclease/putative transposase [Clostridiales bacterium]|jgi:predicted transposase/invertase (TIGR01784 family)|nr:Rpn family recombination-promoting nuclease/putative transposase [Clostridiales bacterium]